jgi:hypothetical protein
MAETIRILMRWSGGSPWAQASGEEKEKAWERWLQVREEWKKDPGIRFICHYRSTAGSSLDGYEDHWLFEVDQAIKAREMAKQYPAEEMGPFEKYSLEIVWGDTETEEAWRS